MGFLFIGTHCIIGSFSLCGLDVVWDVLKLADPFVHALRMRHDVDVRSLPERMTWIPLCTHCACATTWTYVHYPRGRREIGRFGVILWVVTVRPRCDACAVRVSWRRHVPVHVESIQSKSPYVINIHTNIAKYISCLLWQTDQIESVC